MANSCLWVMSEPSRFLFNLPRGKNSHASRNIHIDFDNVFLLSIKKNNDFKIYRPYGLRFCKILNF